MCVIGDATHEPEEDHTMRTPSRQRRRPRPWRSALATWLSSAVLLIAVSAAAAQPTPASPASTAGKVYVGVFKDNTVSVIDTTTDQVVSGIDVGPNPHGLAISPDGRRLLVMAFGANQAIVIDTTS